MSSEINNFFYPNSVCVVGASTKEKSIGYELLKTIKTYSFTGEVFPVNPKADEVLGYKCFKSIAEIKKKIDLAIIVVPKQFAEDSIDQLLEKGVKSIVLITAGFKEIGKEGEEVELRLVEKVKKAGARMVGPNCMGVISTLNNIRLNATFVAEKPEFGKTGFLSQSGALGAAVLNSLRETDIKFAHFVSVGNKADIDENDFISFWQNDDNIKTLTFYLESFVNGEEFVKPFMTGQIDKPAIVLKAGKTESGMKAASSHTGALSSMDKVVDSMLNQFGIIRADDLNELFNTAKGFENFPVPLGNRVAVVTNAGGPAILTVDKIDKEGLTLADFSEETKTKLREIVHSEGSVNNPVDLLPGGNAEIYSQVNKIVSEDENVDAVISIFVEPVMVEPMSVVEGVASVKSQKPIMQVVMPLPEFWEAFRKNEKITTPLFRNPEDPAEVLGNMYFHSTKQKSISSHSDEYNVMLDLKSVPFSAGDGYLDQAQVKELISGYDIPLINDQFFLPEEISNAELNYPVVLKGINEKVIHKTELNAVKLDIKNREELLIAADDISKNFGESGYSVELFMLQPFIKTAHEILIGGFRDPSFGPIIMFGTGGKYVEVYNDTVMKSAFISDDDIDDMVDKTAIGTILKGVRGDKPADLKQLKSIMKSAAKMLIEYSNIEEFDFNPLLVSHNGLFHAVDVRIKINNKKGV